MVSDRQICAAIDQTEGMVHFFERPEKFDSELRNPLFFSSTEF
jgi:hypothetical protein